MLSEEPGAHAKVAWLPILSELLGDVPLGSVLSILFDPDAQETALLVNTCAGYLSNGGDVLYFSDSQPVPELRRRFEKLGLNIAEYEAEDSAVLFDSYSAQMGTKSTEKYHAQAMNLNELSIAMAEAAPQWPPGSLIVYESLSHAAFGQESVYSKFSRKAIGIWQPRGTITLAGFTVGLHPPGFYQDAKLISNGVVELKLEEYQGEIVNTIRARSFKGQNVDTRVRRIVFDNNMKASLVPMKA
jgi:archaellum biogenesis ATPase FlaH